jgi:hypothetical protein
METEAEFLVRMRAKVESIRADFLAEWPSIEKKIDSIPQDIRDRCSLAGPIAKLQSSKAEWLQVMGSASSAATSRELKGLLPRTNELITSMGQLFDLIVETSAAAIYLNR